MWRDNQGRRSEGSWKNPHRRRQLGVQSFNWVQPAARDCPPACSSLRMRGEISITDSVPGSPQMIKLEGKGT